MRRNVRRSFSEYLCAIFAAALMATGVVNVAQAGSESLGTMTVFKSPYCGCCAKWVDYMRAHGFEVAVRNMEDISAIKKLAGVPAGMESCHTALIDERIIEGHVPVEAVQVLLDGDSQLYGLAVPGMPSGSPGMEGGPPEAYTVYSLASDGVSEVFMSRPAQ